MFLLNLLNKLGKRDKMGGLLSILSLFRNEFNKFNKRRAGMLDSNSKRYLNYLKIAFYWREDIKILSSFKQH